MKAMKATKAMKTTKKAAASATKKTAVAAKKKKGSTKAKASTADTLTTIKDFLSSAAGEAEAAAEPNEDGDEKGVEEEARAPARKASKAMKKMGKMSLAVKKKPAAATSSSSKGSKPKGVKKSKVKSKALVVAAVDDVTRDRMKNYYFQEQIKNETLDPELRDLWDKVRGNRKKETMLINGCMVKANNGKFKVDKDSPKFQEVSSRISQTYWKDEHKGIPESLAIVKFKGEQQLRQAIERGDVKETVDGGQKFYSWRTIMIGRGGSSKTTHSVAKQGGIDDATYKKLSAMLSKVGWSFNFTKIENEATQRGLPLPKDAEAKLELARTALEKLSKTAVSTFSKMKEFPKNDLVQQASGVLSQQLKQIRATQNELESLAVLGKNTDGSPPTCSSVMTTLAGGAKLLEETFAHLKACGGLLRSSK